MARGRPKAVLSMSEDERSQLMSFARSRSLPSALSSRAKIILASADGEANSCNCGASSPQPGHRSQVAHAVHRAPHRGALQRSTRGRARTIDDERLAGLINTTLHTKPADGSTHWSVRSVADETGISKTSVHRYFKLFGLQPHRSEHFKLSTDAFFIEKLRDVVGLVPEPARQRAGALCRREEPVPGARADSADAALGAGLRRRRDA